MHFVTPPLHPFLSAAPFLAHSCPRDPGAKEGAHLHQPDPALQLTQREKPALPGQTDSGWSGGKVGQGRGREYRAAWITKVFLEAALEPKSGALRVQAAGQQVRRCVHDMGGAVGRVPECRGTLVSGAVGGDLEVLRDDRAHGRSAVSLDCDVLPGPEADAYVDVLGHSPGRGPVSGEPASQEVESVGPQPGTGQPSPHSSQMQRVRSRLPPALERKDGVGKDHALLHEQDPREQAGSRREAATSWSLGLGGPPGPGASDTEQVLPRARERRRVIGKGED